MQSIFIKKGHKKPTIVFLHGWGRSKETWKHIVDDLSGSFTVYALDLPGFGDNQPLPHIYTLEDYVTYLHTFLEKKHIKRPILVGWSFGAKVAALYTLTYPGNVMKLVLYSSSLPAKNMLPNYRSMRKFILSPLLILVSVITRSLRNKNVRLADYNELKKLYYSVGRPFGGRLMQITTPTLIIAGRFDFLTLLSYQKKISNAIPNAKLVIFNYSTHRAHAEEKKKFITTLREFIG